MPDTPSGPLQPMLWTLPPYVHCRVGFPGLVTRVFPLESRIWYMTRACCGRASVVVPSFASITLATFLSQNLEDAYHE